jgi:hypothetical protein
MNKSLPAAEHSDTLDRSSSYWSADGVLGYGSLDRYLENANRDGAYRFQQSVNLLAFGSELAFFDFWKQD